MPSPFEKKKKASLLSEIALFSRLQGFHTPKKKNQHTGGKKDVIREVSIGERFEGEGKLSEKKDLLPHGGRKQEEVRWSEKKIESRNHELEARKKGKRRRRRFL